jgi:hypothetical protein
MLFDVEVCYLQTTKLLVVKKPPQVTAGHYIILKTWQLLREKLKTVKSVMRLAGVFACIFQANPARWSCTAESHRIFFALSFQPLFPSPHVSLALTNGL